MDGSLLFLAGVGWTAGGGMEGVYVVEWKRESLEGS